MNHNNNKKRQFQYGNVGKYIKNKRVNKGIEDKNIIDSNNGNALCYMYSMIILNV